MVFQERTYSVLLVSASDKFNATTTTLLPVTDYWPVTTVKSIAEAKRRLLDQPYDIILINAPLPDDFGMRLAIDACNESGAGVLLLVKSEHYNDIYSKVVMLPLTQSTYGKFILLTNKYVLVNNILKLNIRVSIELMLTRLVVRLRWGTTERKHHTVVTKI